MSRFRAMGKNAIDFGWVAGTFVVVCIVWQLSIYLFKIPEFVLPSIREVMDELVENPAFYANSVAFTLSTSVAGFVIATVVGSMLSVAVITSRTLDKLLMTLLALVNSVPKAALAPLFVIWLGAGFAPKLAIATLMALLVVVVGTVTGLRSVDPEMISLAQVYGASRSAILFKVRLPFAFPQMLASWKTAISLSVVGAIVGEFVAGNQGLGSAIVVAQGSFNTPRAFAAIFLLSVMATALFYAVVLLEYKLLGWHVSQRNKH
ncbi:MAG: ABC transporter permease [Janthinobacterium lividum]